MGKGNGKVIEDGCLEGRLRWGYLGKSFQEGDEDDSKTFRGTTKYPLTGVHPQELSDVKTPISNTEKKKTRVFHCVRPCTSHELFFLLFLFTKKIFIPHRKDLYRVWEFSKERWPAIH